MEVEKNTQIAAQHVEAADKDAPLQQELHVHSTTWLAFVVGSIALIAPRSLLTYVTGHQPSSHRSGYDIDW